MIDKDFINKQLENAKASMEILKSQNEMIGKSIQGVLESVPEDQKNEVQRLQVIAQKSFNFAKEGKIEKAKEILKQFEDGRKNNRS